MKFVFKGNLTIFILVFLTFLNVSYAFAEECKIIISGTDMMRFDTTEINIDENCDKFVIEKPNKMRH